MGKLKFDVPHSLSKDEARKRVESLAQHWGSKYGVTTTWNGDSAQLSGKVMGITIDATLQISDNRVGGEATDPGMLFREKARRYLTEKFSEALGPTAKV
jgi:hypothetical protein